MQKIRIEDIIIRKANIEDKLQLVEIFQHYQNEIIIQKRIECYLSHNNTVIAQKEKDIIGKIQWYIKEDPNMGIAELEEVYVLEEFRNKGIGSGLINFSLRSIEDFFTALEIIPRRVFLFVDEKNTAARKMYEKNGFKHICKIEDLFIDNETTLIYILNLENQN